jgi:hypothetical protein
MCGSERRVGNESESNDAADNFEPVSKDALSSSVHLPLSQIPEKSQNVAGTEQEARTEGAQTVLDASRRGRFGILGAAVTRSTRLKQGEQKDSNSQDGRNRLGGRFNFRKRSSMSSNESIFEGGATTLKNIHASARAVPVGELDAAPVPLKMFEVQWVVSVKSGRNPPETDHKTGECSGEMVQTNVSNDDTEKQPFEDKGNEEAAERQSDAPEKPQIAVGTGGNSCNPGMKLNAETMDDVAPGDQNFFRVRVFRADQANIEAVFEKTFSLGDVLQLYAQISESLERMLPQLVDDKVQADKKISGPTDGRSPKPTGLFLVDKVMVTGRILGGLLDLEITSDVIEKTHNYQGESCCAV